MISNRDEFEKERKSRLDLLFSIIKQRLIYFCTPDVLLQKDEYKERPGWGGWLTVVLKSLQNAQYLVAMGDELRGTSNDEKEIFDRILKSVYECTEHNLVWVREQLHCELKEDLVSYYYPTTWVDAIEDGLQDEDWYLFNNRDGIEAHLNAPMFLHPDLIPDLKLVRLVKKADLILQKKLIQWRSLIPIVDYELDQKLIFFPRSHWWWWRDEEV